MKDKKVKRPYWCYDKSAKVVYSSFDKIQMIKGFSMFCYGKLKIARSDMFNKVDHANDICHCYYTPFKGAIRFFMNKDDLWGETIAIIAVMNRVIKGIKCNKHKGEKAYKIIQHECGKCAKEKFNQPHPK